MVCVEQPDGDAAHADLHAAEQPADQRNQRLQPKRLRRACSPLLGRAGCRRRSACTGLQDEHEAGQLDPRVLPPRHLHPHTLESTVHQPQPEDRKRRVCSGRVDPHVLDLKDARAQSNRAVVEVEDICIGSDAGVMGDGIECLQYGGICGLLFGLLHAIVKEDALLMDVLFQAQDLMIVCGQRIVIVVEQIIIHELKKRH